MNTSDSLRQCSRALRRISGAADIAPTAAELASIERVRKLLRVYVHTLSSSKPRNTVVAPVLRMLHDMHPRTDYTVPERALLDIIDMSLTLARLTEGRHRDDRQKIVDACMFFLALSEEVLPSSSKR